MEKGKILSINISDKRGIKKTPVQEAEISAGDGIVGDAHAGFLSHREISVLAIESHNKMLAKGANVKPGDFAENITTEGLNVFSLPIGTRVKFGSVETEVTQIGKECHSHCAIFHQVGECVMPKEGIFVKSLNSGTIRVGDTVEVISRPTETVPK